MVFQNYALYPHMTVETNIGFPLAMRRHTKRPSRAVREVAALVGLTDHLTKYPDQLSGGQRQRVALGRAIIREPVAFLMDEPLSNLDALLRVQMRTGCSSCTSASAHDDLCHPRPDRGDDDGRPHRRPPRRRHEAGGNTERGLQPPRRHLLAIFVGSPPMNLIRAVSHRRWWTAVPGRSASISLPWGRWLAPARRSRSASGRRTSN